MRKVRIFLSSPGDVADERRRAREILEGFAKRGAFEGKVHVDVVAWDDPRAPALMDARFAPQANVDRAKGTPADCDATVVVLWSRMGTPPGARKPDGTPYLSGTEYEFDLAVRAGKPVFVYHRTEVPQSALGAKDLAERVEQYERVQAFLASFKAADGTPRFSFRTYATPHEFAELLRANGEVFIRDLLASETTARTGTTVRVEAAGLSASDAALLTLATTRLEQQNADALRQALLGVMGGAEQTATAAAAASPPVLAVANYVGRREWFGSLIYDRRHDDYIAFGAEETALFVRGQHESLATVAAAVADDASRAVVDRYLQLCRSIDLVDEHDRVPWSFLDDRAAAGRLAAPTFVHYACTSACTFACEHCFSNSGLARAGELTTAQACALIDEMASIGALQLRLGGGEPLVRADLPALVRHANERGVSVSISTNAVAATDSVVAALAGCRIAAVLVSMDAASAEIYDRMRGEAGAFEQALAGLRRLQALKAPLVFRTMVTSSTIDQVAAVARLAAANGVARVDLRPVMAAGRAARHTGLTITTADMNRVWESLAGITAETGVAIDAPERVPRDRRWLMPGFGCECGHTRCYIDSRGHVSPSGLVSAQPSAASVREQPLREIWASDPAIVRFRMQAGNETCAGCGHFRGCRGGCRASAVVRGRDLSAPDPFCAIAEAAAAAS